MPLDVTVAPETASTPSRPLAATMRPGSCSMALEPMPWVSPLSPTTTETMAAFWMVTVTSKSPAMPCPVPVYTPSAQTVDACAATASSKQDCTAATKSW
jgi:hypothetical protein